MTCLDGWYLPLAGRAALAEVERAGSESEGGRMSDDRKQVSGGDVLAQQGQESRADEEAVFSDLKRGEAWGSPTRKGVPPDWMGIRNDQSGMLAFWLLRCLTYLLRARCRTGNNTVHLLGCGRRSPRRCDIVARSEHRTPYSSGHSG